LRRAKKTAFFDAASNSNEFLKNGDKDRGPSEASPQVRRFFKEMSLDIARQKKQRRGRG